MWDTRANKFVLVAGTLILLGGCQNVGPIAIDQGRDRYNNIIETTSKEQTLSNVVRVYNHEPTAFMDVTEVDATTSFTGTVAGGIANIGARAGTSGGTLAGQTGSVAGGVTYSESPLIRYQPLLGQPLVAQLATPVGPDALASLYDSSWGVMPLLDLATSFLTLDQDEFYAALNIIAELDSDRAVELVAEKSDVTKAKDSTATGTLKQNKGGNITLEVTNKASGTGANDALVIYFLPFHPHATRRDLPEKRREIALWLKLLWLYRGTQRVFKAQEGVKCPSNILDLVDLEEARKCMPTSIELRTMPVKPENVTDGLTSGAPTMRTYSALGILKNATEQPWPKIGFVSPDVYGTIRSYPWNDFHKDTDLNFYTLLPHDEYEGDEKLASSTSDQMEDAKITRKVSDWLWSNRNPYIYEPKPAKSAEDEYVRANNRLGHLRRYILIVKADHAPADAYAAHFYHGEWYYIARDDHISQKNFNLISLFLTMMAAPSATPPLSPTISVGGM
ncbi:MAG TPA: hypothetical protein VK749_22400 [Xanthobacteraceae bacterium]|jgi:hypothetical protein|nr:hypothetical protein [Xanthobacteraceae bacterium]